MRDIKSWANRTKLLNLYGGNFTVSLCRTTIFLRLYRLCALDTGCLPLKVSQCTDWRALKSRKRPQRTGSSALTSRSEYANKSKKVPTNQKRPERSCHCENFTTLWALKEIMNRCSIRLTANLRKI